MQHELVLSSSKIWTLWMHGSRPPGLEATELFTALASCNFEGLRVVGIPDGVDAESGFHPRLPRRFCRAKGTYQTFVVKSSQKFNFAVFSPYFAIYGTSGTLSAQAACPSAEYEVYSFLLCSRICRGRFVCLFLSCS
jgi:hypothetical protein